MLYKILIVPYLILVAPLLLVVRGVLMIALLYFYGFLFYLLDRDYPRHLSDGRRRVVEFVDRCMGRSLLLVQGLVVVTKNSKYYKGSRIIVANHNGPNDTLVSAATFPGIPVSKQGYANLWPFYQVAKANRAFLTKRGKISRKVAAICPDTSITDRMVQHLGSSAIPIGIFPEGTVARREYLMRFKTSVFRLGAPVTPVTINYHTVFQSRWQLQHWCVIVLQLMTNPFGLVTVEFHPPMSVEENEEAQDFADRVAAFMAAKLQISYVPYTQPDKMYFNENGKLDNCSEPYVRRFAWMGRYKEFCRRAGYRRQLGLYDDQIARAKAKFGDQQPEHSAGNKEDSAFTSVTML